MTAQELYALCFNLMGIEETDANYSNSVFMSILNTVLNQTLGLENANREYKELTVLTSSQVITSMSDVLTYQDNVIRNVVVFGVAQLIAMNEEDYDKSGFFEQRYSDGMNREDRTIPIEIEDYYSMESEE